MSYYLEPEGAHKYAGDSKASTMDTCLASDRETSPEVAVVNRNDYSILFRPGHKSECKDLITARDKRQAHGSIVKMSGLDQARQRRHIGQSCLRLRPVSGEII